MNPPAEAVHTLLGEKTLATSLACLPTVARYSADPVRLGSWTFEKDVLRRLVTTDERFGKCYALFLPWPTHRPDITRVRLATRYEKLAVSYLAVVHVAMIRLYLKRVTTALSDRA